MYIRPRKTIDINMSNKFNWMPILRTGTFTDKNKQAVSIDEAALDKIVESTDLSKEPQLVVEHPNFDSIGFGTIEKLKRVGNYLFALPRKVEEKFKAAVNTGRLPGRSVTIDKKNFSLRNISFLPPNIPPAVSGLGAYSFQQENAVLKLEYAIPGVESHFADIETSDYEFARYEISKYPFKTIQNIFRNIKNFFIEERSAEDADKIIPEWLLSEVGTVPVISEKEENNKMLTNFSQKNNGDNKMSVQTIDLSKVDLTKIDPNLRRVIEGLQTQNTALEADLNEKTVELHTAAEKISASEKAANRNTVLQFCESEAVKKVKPADKEKAVNFLLAQKEKGVIEFSADDNSKVKLDCFEFAKGLILAQPDFISDQEIAKKNNAVKSKVDIEFAGMNVNEDSLAIHKRALELQSADGKLSYEIAVNRAAAELK